VVVVVNAVADADEIRNRSSGHPIEKHIRLPTARRLPMRGAVLGHRRAHQAPQAL